MGKHRKTGEYREKHKGTWENRGKQKETGKYGKTYQDEEIHGKT